MTINSERCMSVRITRDFLRELLYPAETPKIPRRVRERARMCLRHFPSDFELIGPYFDKEEFARPAHRDGEEGDEEEEGPDEPTGPIKLGE